METLQNSIKHFSPLTIFLKYFVIVGCAASWLNDLYGPALAIIHFISSFLIFIDEDFIDPEVPNEIDDIGKEYTALFT